MSGKLFGEAELWESLERRVSENRPKLKPAKSIKRKIPRVCATCKHWLMASGSGFCERENGYSCDAGDLLQWTTTCAMYRKDSNY